MGRKQKNISNIEIENFKSINYLYIETLKTNFSYIKFISNSLVLINGFGATFLLKHDNAKFFIIEIMILSLAACVAALSTLVVVIGLVTSLHKLSDDIRSGNYNSKKFTIFENSRYCFYTWVAFFVICASAFMFEGALYLVLKSPYF